VRGTKAFRANERTRDATTKLLVKKCYAQSFGIDLYERMASGTAGFMLRYYRAAERKTDKRLIGHCGVIPVYHD